MPLDHKPKMPGEPAGDAWTLPPEAPAWPPPQTLPPDAAVDLSNPAALRAFIEETVSVKVDATIAERMEFNLLAENAGLGSLASRDPYPLPDLSKYTQDIRHSDLQQLGSMEQFDNPDVPWHRDDTAIPLPAHYGVAKESWHNPAETSTLAGTPTYDSGTGKSTVTVADALFVSGVLGKSLLFTSIAGSFEVVEIVSETECKVSGNASAALNGEAVRIEGGMCPYVVVNPCDNALGDNPTATDVTVYLPRTAGEGQGGGGTPFRLEPNVVSGDVVAYVRANDWTYVAVGSYLDHWFGAVQFGCNKDPDTGSPLGAPPGWRSMTTGEHYADMSGRVPFGYGTIADHPHQVLEVVNNGGVEEDGIHAHADHDDHCHELGTGGDLVQSGTPFNVRTGGALDMTGVATTLVHDEVLSLPPGRVLEVYERYDNSVEGTGA